MKMKKVIICLTAAFALVIVFFTFFGEKLYYSTKPEVELDRAVNIDGVNYLPESAVFTDDDSAYAYTVSAYEGFSTTIYTVTAHKLLTYVPMEGFEGYVGIYTEEENVGGLFVISSSKQLYDGERVIVKE